MKNYFLFLVVLVFISCGENSSRKVINLNSTIDSIKSSKIIVYLNAECHYCLTKYKNEKRIYNKLKAKYKLPFYTIIYCNDTVFIKNYLDTKIGKCGKLIFDIEDTFNRKNQLGDDYKKHFMILNSKNEILINGDLSNNKKLLLKVDKLLNSEKNHR